MHLSQGGHLPNVAFAFAIVSPICAMTPAYDPASDSPWESEDFNGRTVLMKTSSQYTRLSQPHSAYVLRVRASRMERIRDTRDLENKRVQYAV